MMHLLLRKDLQTIAVAVKMAQPVRLSLENIAANVRVDTLVSTVKHVSSCKHAGTLYVISSFENYNYILLFLDVPPLEFEEY